METLSRLNTIFGAQLRSARKAAHLTQEELAFRANLDRTYISLLERVLTNWYRRQLKKAIAPSSPNGKLSSRFR